MVNAGMDLLTPREEQSMRRVADGLGNREIAERLNLREAWSNILFHIFDKLGSRIALSIPEDLP
jgi:DNA-binding NarL/FixJ family response regulator